MAAPEMKRNSGKIRSSKCRPAQSTWVNWVFRSSVSGLSGRNLPSTALMAAVRPRMQHMSKPRRASRETSRWLPVVGIGVAPCAAAAAVSGLQSSRLPQRRRSGFPLGRKRTGGVHPAANRLVSAMTFGRRPPARSLPVHRAICWPALYQTVTKDHGGFFYGQLKRQGSHCWGRLLTWKPVPRGLSGRCCRPCSRR